jgi:uncharacterized membrane protein YkvA (DUF1232 family)
MRIHDKTRQTDERISAERVQRSAFFLSALERAAEFLRQPRKLIGLADRASQKYLHLPEPLSGLRETLSTCLRLVRAWASGSYREIPSASLVSIVAALIYFVAPVDLVPDFILALGLVDDAALLGWVLSSVSRDIDRFLDWEIEQGPGSTGILDDA